MQLIPTLERLGPNEVTREVVTDIQHLHRDGWIEDMRETRTVDEINHRFPLSGDGFDEAGAQYQDFARHGNLVTARRNGRLVGVSMTRADVGPVRVPGVVPVAIRTGKRIHGFFFPKHSKVHPWTFSIVTDPAEQRKHVASSMLRLSHRGFNQNLQATSYVFDENPAYEFDDDGQVVDATALQPFSHAVDPAYEFFRASGYSLTALSDHEGFERRIRRDYFGPGTRPVVQYILKATVEAVRVNTASRPLRIQNA